MMVLREPRKGRHGQAWRLARVFFHSFPALLFIADLPLRSGGGTCLLVGFCS